MWEFWCGFVSQMVNNFDPDWNVSKSIWCIDVHFLILIKLFFASFTLPLSVLYLFLYVLFHQPEFINTFVNVTLHLWTLRLAPPHECWHRAHWDGPADCPVWQFHWHKQTPNRTAFIYTECWDGSQRAECWHSRGGAWRSVHKQCLQWCL